MSYESEENAIYEAFERGEIDESDLRDEMRMLEQDRRASAEEAAQEAYDREMGQW